MSFRMDSFDFKKKMIWNGIKWVSEWMRNDNRIRKRNWVSIDVRSLEECECVQHQSISVLLSSNALMVCHFFVIIIVVAVARSISSSSLPCSSAGAVAHSRFVLSVSVRMANFFPTKWQKQPSPTTKWATENDQKKEKKIQTENQHKRASTK